MLKLFYAPDNASMILRLALEEIGVPYETVLVDRSSGGQNTPEYLALNPTGLIPTLITPDGALAETAACLLWLAETYPEVNLAPAPGTPHRGEFLRWLFYLSNTVHADLIRMFYPDRYVPQETLEVHHTMMAQNLSKHFKILERAVGEHSNLFAPPSALSLYLAPCLRWAGLYPRKAERWLDLSLYPGLTSLLTSLETRPSVQVAIKIEGLGSQPFTSPKVPGPPNVPST